MVEINQNIRKSIYLHPRTNLKDGRKVNLIEYLHYI